MGIEEKQSYQPHLSSCSYYCRSGLVSTKEGSEGSYYDTNGNCECEDVLDDNLTSGCPSNKSGDQRLNNDEDDETDYDADYSFAHLDSDSVRILRKHPRKVPLEKVGKSSLICIVKLQEECYLYGAFEVSN